MKKALICILALTLILFSFTACKNDTPTPGPTPEPAPTPTPEPTPGPETNVPKATFDQQFLFQQLYRQSLLNSDVETEGVALTNGVYTFTDVAIDDSIQELEGTLSGTFKNTDTEISIDVSYTDLEDKTTTVSGTLARNGQGAVITVNGEECLIHNHQVPPFLDQTKPIPEANKKQDKIFNAIFGSMNIIISSTTPHEGFTKAPDDYFIFENVQILDKDGNVEEILNGKVLGGAYLNLTRQSTDGVINTIITFFDKDTKPNTYILFIDGEACTKQL